MADTKKYGWNVQIDGVQYLVEYMKGSIFINGGEAFKLRSLATGTFMLKFIRDNGVLRPVTFWWKGSCETIQEQGRIKAGV